MAGPSSEGRPSISSAPSVTSSSTLNSRYSGYQDNGEGSASQRPPLGPMNNGGAERVSEIRSRNPGSLLSGESIQEHDFAHRRQRNRSSGGFLLDSAFAGRPRLRHSYNSARAEDVKGERNSHQGQTSQTDGNGRLRAGNGAANGSPLLHEVRTADQNAVDQRSKADPAHTQDKGDGGLQVPKMRKNTQRIQTAAHDREAELVPEVPRSSIDPNQIVNMALNLSESRRRNLSAGQLLASQPRVSSGIHQDGSIYNKGSLRHYLNEQRRVSRTISPFGGRSSPSRHMSASLQRSGSLFIEGRPFDPSDATLARRDKAVAFFELRMQYLRLLDLLPPLKPDATEPSNYTFATTNVPGSPNVHMMRMPSSLGKKYELGRPYNPLQCLRNRRTRARERRAFDHPPEEFSDINQVKEWVNRVEWAAQHPQYRQDNGVALPKIHDDHTSPSVSSKSARPHTVWTFTAEELLADAHWLENGDNKSLIEDRHGRKLFPPQEPPKQDFLQPRSSKDYPEKRRRSWVEGLPGLSGDPVTGDESEAQSERGRKRRLLPTFRAESPKTKKHAHTSSGQHTTGSIDTSDSDSDARQYSRKPRKTLEKNKDTGPLELRMKELLEKEAKEAQTKLKSPAVFTPDTPNKWGKYHDEATDPKTVPGLVDTLETTNGPAVHAPLGLKLPPKNRIDTGLSVEPSSEPRSSFEDFDSTTPGTPPHPKHFPHIGSDISPPPSRAGSEKRRSKKSKLDIFRSDESTKGHKHEPKIDPESSTSDKKQDSRQASEDIDEGHGFESAIWAAPGAVKNLLRHRKNDSVSSLQSPIKETRRDTKDFKEPPSAVSRFFKGVKHEGSKVEKFIFRKERLPEESDFDTASDHPTAESDLDDDIEKRDRTHRPRLVRSTTAETAGSMTSKKSGRYHLELPSFRPTHLNKTDEEPGYATDSRLGDHHITRQAREHASRRSPRFDQLAPPRMDLSRISSDSLNQERMSKILARPGGVGQGGLPVTALANGDALYDSNQQRSNSRPTLEGRRHWSITDDDGNVLHSKPVSHMVTQADIARIRALFLCSGVKAKEISRRAYEVRAKPAAFLTRVAEASNAQLYPVPRKNEHVLAAHILIREIESSTQALQASANEFRESTVEELMSLISSLKTRVDSDMFSTVRNSSTEAVKITSEVSSNAPLTVKQINDEIDRMLRIRRRRMRYIRRVGWTLVEWMLLGFMWCAWLSVMVFGFIGRVFGFGWKVVRWLLWI